MILTDVVKSSMERHLPTQPTRRRTSLNAAVHVRSWQEPHFPHFSGIRWDRAPCKTLHLDKVLGSLVVSRGSPDGFPSAGSVVDSDVEESIDVRDTVTAAVNARAPMSTGF